MTGAGRSRAIWAGVLGLLGAAAVLVRVGGERAAHPTGGEPARRHFLSGLDRLAHFDDAGMWREFRAAWTADPAYLPVYHEVIGLDGRAPVPEAVAAELDSLVEDQPDTDLRLCLGRLLATGRGVMPPPAPLSHGSTAARTCVADLLLERPRQPGERLDRIALARHLWRQFPESPSLTVRYTSELGFAGRPESVLALARQLVGPQQNAFVRVAGYIETIGRLHQLGRHEEALQWEQRADAATRSSQGIRLRYLWSLANRHRYLLRELGSDSVFRQHAGVAAQAEAGEALGLAMGARWTGTLSQTFRTDRADQLLDNGELTTSLEEWTQLVRLGDSAGDPLCRAHARVRRGRTLVKLGRATEAEADLLAGLTAARRARNIKWQYEAEHNLLHLYEATGSASQAQRAGEGFVALARESGVPQANLMANHDLAWFHLRRGARERARRYFENVVAYADSVVGYEYWAGEYFELTGDLDRAEASFRRAGIQQDIRPIAGLSRLAEATGDLERAIRFARIHDQLRESSRYPEFAPLLPGLLARHGRLAEAASELAPARNRAIAGGQVAAWATLSAELAMLELHRGNPAAAAAIADSAEGAASRLGVAEVQWRAHAITGLARVRAGGTEVPAGLAGVRLALSQAVRTGLPQLQGELLAWYGEALAARGRIPEALVSFGRAADFTDSVALSLSLDPARAGYRSAQAHISNAALEAILGHPDRVAAARWYASWSVRRKSRGVLDRIGGWVAPSLAAVRHSLPPDHAVLDYAVLDSTVAVLVITDHDATLRRLPVTPDTLRARVGALLARLVPRIGSLVDTAHAALDAELSEQLYTALLAPVEPDLGGRTHLSIVPDGPLHLLPFDALVITRTPVTQYTLDRFRLTLAPSLSLVMARDRPLSAGPVLGVVGPAAPGIIEGADRELAALARALAPREVHLLQRLEATEAAVRGYARGAALLHVAAHARPNDAEPAYARLALIPEGTDDGLLHAYEIERLPLPGTLVVLSACETGVGRLLGGEGVLSLSRAFLRAGARGTVATLWPTGPASADLMAAFYPALARGEAPAAALREAKLALRHGQWSNPFHWAGFVLVTRGD